MDDQFKGNNIFLAVDTERTGFYGDFRTIDREMNHSSDGGCNCKSDGDDHCLLPSNYLLINKNVYISAYTLKHVE